VTEEVANIHPLMAVALLKTKIALAAIILSVFTVSLVSVMPVAVNVYTVTVEVDNQSLWPATIYGVQLTASAPTGYGGSWETIATVTLNNPVTIPARAKQQLHLTLNMFADANILKTLPDGTPVKIVGTVEVGAPFRGRYTILINEQTTLGELKTEISELYPTLL